MTKKNIALTELAGKGSDIDILRDMLGYVYQQLMDIEVANHCKAGYGERTGELENARNGYRERDWETRGCR
jgi:putative transposase